MAAPLGIFILYESSKPLKQPKKLRRIDQNIILPKCFEKIFAVAGGIVKREISRIIPTTLILKTIAIAIKVIST